jgi:septal ring factor EnvC (AmiA/AmiB activator)
MTDPDVRVAVEGLRRWEQELGRLIRQRSGLEQQSDALGNALRRLEQDINALERSLRELSQAR